MKQTFLVALALAIPASSTIAQTSVDRNMVVFDPGNSLMSNCDGEEFPGKVYCLSYIIGAIDALNSWQAISPKTRSICLPKDGSVSKGQLRDIVVKWLRDHAETRNDLAPFLIHNAVNNAFPCVR